jgi:Cu+-exporting ATPase
MAGTGDAAQHGILIKDAEALEVAHSVTTVAFDKTGTLTEGRPSLVAVQAAPGQTQDDVLRLAAALQMSSDHPLAHAVMTRVRADGLAVPKSQDAQALPGRGLKATVEGDVLSLGSSRLLQELNADTGELAREAERLEGEGRTIS